MLGDVGLADACCYIVSTVATVDVMLKGHINDDTTRFFVLHYLFNAWVVYESLDDAIGAIVDPIGSLNHPTTVASQRTMLGIMIFHTYHLVVFTKLTTEDLLHHIINALITPIVGLMLPLGKFISFSNIGMCGIPGGIDYVLLALVKFKVIHSMTEKNINRYLHLLIRLPIQIVLVYMFISHYLMGTLKHFSTTTLSMISFALGVQLFNAVYFTEKVIGNYHTKKLKLKLGYT